MNNNYLTIQQAANHLGVHWQTIRSYIKSGKLPFFKVGRTYRIRQKDIADLTKKSGQRSFINKREIEIRYLLKNRKKIEEKVRKLGAKLSNHSHVIDHYFCDKHITSLRQKDKHYESMEGFTLRIREMDNDYTGKIVTTLEVKKLVDGKNHSNCIETEIVVPDYCDTKELLCRMNMKEFIVIDKERFVYRFKDIKICFDNIQGIGFGLEIEQITKKDFKETEKKLIMFAEKIGLKSKDRVKKSLTYLAMKKMAKF